MTLSNFGCHSSLSICSEFFSCFE